VVKVGEEMQKKISARKGLYLESAGKGCLINGYLGKGVEIWSYPLKIIRNYKASLYLPEKYENIDIEDYAYSVDIYPEKTVINYSHPLFSINEILFSPINKKTSFIIYKISSSTKLDLIIEFIPELNLMWPGSIGGQYCSWSEGNRGYIIGEPAGEFSAIIRSKNAKKYSKEGDHAFSDNPNKFYIENSTAENEIVISVTGVLGNRDKCTETNSRDEKTCRSLIKESKEYYENFMKESVELHTPDPEINGLFEWGKISIKKGIVNNPLLGEGLIAGIAPSGKSTRPGFDWFFAGDMAINTSGILSFGDYELIKNSLKFYSKYQTEDGRIPHEISQSAGLIDWFGKYKGFAYLHADTTAYFILALCLYILETGDIEFAKDMKTSLVKAYEFYKPFCDDNGLILNAKAGLGALEISEFRKPKYDIYTSGIWHAALEKMKTVLELLEDSSILNEVRERTEQLSESMDLFWSEKDQMYCMSINEKNEKLNLVTPWPFFPIAFNTLDEEKSRKTLRKLMESSAVTSWGIRSVEDGKYYDPINYNFGAIWYFFNGYIAYSAYNTGEAEFGKNILQAASKAFKFVETTHMPELFSGDRLCSATTAVDHQLFCVAPLIMALVRGAFGMEIEKGKIKINPKLPLSWGKSEMKNLKIGDKKYSLIFSRKGRDLVLSIKGEGSEKLNVESGYSFSMTGGKGEKVIVLKDAYLPFEIIFSELKQGTDIKGIKINRTEIADYETRVNVSLNDQKYIDIWIQNDYMIENDYDIIESKNDLDLLRINSEEKKLDLIFRKRGAL